MLIPAFPGTIDARGRIHLDDGNQFHRYNLSNFRGKRVQLTVEEIHKPKTPSQNSYFHAVAVPFVAEQAGYNPNYKHDLESVREALKRDFGPKVKIKSIKTGTIDLIPKSIADYTIKDYQFLLDNINQFCVETWGVNLPDPETVKY